MDNFVLWGIVINGSDSLGLEHAVFNVVKQ